MALAKRKPGPEEAPKLDDFLCFAIYSTNLAVNRVYKPLLDQLGLTYPQYIVLVALYDEDDQTVGGLGDKLFLDSSTLTPPLIQPGPPSAFSSKESTLPSAASSTAP